MADSLWLRWIQDNDVCQTYKGVAETHPFVPAESEVFYNPRHKFCDNSWGFKMLDAITTLAPRFKMPYLTGPVSLSVLTEDYDGAKILFDRAIRVYPEDWSLLYRAAYHYLFDRHELPEAAALLIRAGKAGAPEWVNLLAARVYTKSGQIELGITTLENYRRGTTDEKLIADLDKRIAALKKQLNQ